MNFFLIDKLNCDFSSIETSIFCIKNFSPQCKTTVNNQENYFEGLHFGLQIILRSEIEKVPIQTALSQNTEDSDNRDFRCQPGSMLHSEAPQFRRRICRNW